QGWRACDRVTFSDHGILPQFLYLRHAKFACILSRNGIYDSRHVPPVSDKHKHQAKSVEDGLIKSRVIDSTAVSWSLKLRSLAQHGGSLSKKVRALNSPSFCLLRIDAERECHRREPCCEVWGNPTEIA